jgi:hypothetical protein
VQKLDGTLRSFITKHAQAPAKIATVRKVQVSKYEPKMPIKEQPNAQTGGGRGASTKKQGARCNDVKGATLAKRPTKFPGQGLRVANGQLYCGTCGHNIGSGLEDVKKHCRTVKHKQNLEEKDQGASNCDAISTALEEYNGCRSRIVLSVIRFWRWKAWKACWKAKGSNMCTYTVKLCPYTSQTHYKVT